ncbi:MAG: efflux RND transporter periplasmic adaptor subunit, partial [Acidobacteria bacterium]|nr:efflux RND transporter periplasmic adaptor subunit [Acidobacteriota bacterium]
MALLGLLAMLTLGGLFALGYLPHARRERALLAATKEAVAERPVVSVVPVKLAAGSSEVTLPGSMQAMTETPVYARADGYLKRRLVDIGDRVKAGQVLAEIETPELDQQIRQAQANVEQMKAALQQARSSVGQAQANLKLADVTLKRWSALVKEGVMSAQAGDEKQSDFDARGAAVMVAEANVAAATANIQSSEANVKRLTELKGFATVTAPFAGVITERNVDVGALIAAGGNAARAMFTLAEIDTLRIFVNVPQTYSAVMEAGGSAGVTVREFQNRIFAGRISRNASSLDEKSHT